MPHGRFTKTVKFISHIHLVKRPPDTWKETRQTSCLSHSKWTSQIFFTAIGARGEITHYELLPKTGVEKRLLDFVLDSQV